MRRPGIEPGPPAWKAGILTTELTTRIILKMRPPGIEPGSPRPQRGVLPLNQRRLLLSNQRKEMRHPGIEPGAPRWQRGILPLNQWRCFVCQNDPGGTRTPNRLIRSQARYPLRHGTFDL